MSKSKDLVHEPRAAEDPEVREHLSLCDISRQARVSKRWLLGDLGILLFCSPGFCAVGGLLRALV